MLAKMEASKKLEDSQNNKEKNKLGKSDELLQKIQ